MSERALQQMLYGELDPTSLLQRIAEKAIDLLDGADGSSVFMLSDGVLRTVATTIDADRVGRCFPASGRFADQIFARGTPFWCDDILSEARIPPEFHGDGRTRSVIAAPLFVDDRPIGMLSVVSRQPDAFDGEDLCSLLRVCEFAGVAVGASLETAEAARGVIEALDQPMLVPQASGQPTARHGDPLRVSEFLADVTRPGSVARLRTEQRVRSTLECEMVRCVLQPVVDLRHGQLAGAEALARFPSRPRRGPDVWFAEAHAVGLGVELETLALRRALETMDAVPDLPLLGINITPDVLLGADLPRLLEPFDGDRIILELTEHLVIDCYDHARRAMNDLRSLGIRLAIDDVGAGYSSLRHVVELEPDCMKLDRAFIAEADRRQMWPRMAHALVEVASGMGADVVAEGIETEAQLKIAQQLGIGLGQGYLLARPSEPLLMPATFDHLSAHLQEAPVADLAPMRAA